MLKSLIYKLAFFTFLMAGLTLGMAITYYYYNGEYLMVLGGIASAIAGVLTLRYHKFKLLPKNE